VCATRAAWWRAFLCLVIGVLAALSLAPYLPVMRAVTAWNVIVQEPVTIRSIAARVAQAVDAAGPTVGAVWRVLIAAAVVVPVARLARRAWTVRDDERLRLYGALVIVLAAPAMFAVVKGAGYGTQAWYYLPAMALAAIAAEAAVWGRDASPGSMAARLALATVIVALSVAPLRRETHVRRTNMDLVAERVGAEASDQDLVVVNPFWCGVSFSYYYRGRAPWLALPEVAPAQAANPYPVIRDAMTRADPIEPALARLRATLERGGRVWFVGGYLVPRGPALRLAPAPDPRYGWSNGAYADAWSLQAGEFVRTHALRANRIPSPAPRAVSSFENLSLVTVDGWRP
jgi:hypothetical protein